MNTCPKCESQIDGDSAFCAQCGNTLAASTGSVERFSKTVSDVRTVKLNPLWLGIPAVILWYAYSSLPFMGDGTESYSMKDMAAIVSSGQASLPTDIVNAFGALPYLLFAAVAVVAVAAWWWRRPFKWAPAVVTALCLLGLWVANQAADGVAALGAMDEPLSTGSGYSVAMLALLAMIVVAWLARPRAAQNTKSS